MIKEVEAKSLLRRQKHIDSWFLSSGGINLYRGCTHNCVYCDGRDQKYQVEGDFGSEVSIKINAVQLLERELDPARRRKPFAGGFMFVCGGVSDSYQHFEKEYGITRRSLELLLRFGHPVHMLTKSTLIERDMELLGRIRDRKAAVISFSFSTVDDGLARKLEPGVPPPSARLETIRRFTEAGFSCGVYLMPVVPFLTDSPEQIEAAVAAAKTAGASFICFSGMTLKPGRQKDYFMSFLAGEFPDLLPRYEKLYGNADRWGSPPGDYAAYGGRVFEAAAAKYRIPKRMPVSIWSGLVSRSEQIILMLEQLGYLADLKGRNNPYTAAAWTLKKTEQPVELLGTDELCRFPGIGDFTARLIREIAETGSCSYYKKLIVT